MREQSEIREKLEWAPQAALQGTKVNCLSCARDASMLQLGSDHPRATFDKPAPRGAWKRLRIECAWGRR